MNVNHTFVPISGTVNPFISAAGTIIALKAPAASRGGGITILEAFAEFEAGTAPWTLVDLGTDAITVSGTACAISGAYTAAAPIQPGTPAGYFLQAGRYLGVVTGVGTVTTPGGIHIMYTMGRGAA